jgi:hypothetical protein
MKGISFASLNVDYLNQVARDTNVRIGCDNDKLARLINNIIAEEKLQYDQFVGENPDIVLPSNLDVDMVSVESVQESTLHRESSTPTETFKVSDLSTPWTEVVRKGKSRNKSTK